MMIDLQGTYFSYNARPVLKNISFCIEEGEFVGIIGPNGAGKSTLLKLIVGILQPQKGKVSLLDKSIGKYNRKHLAKLVGFVPQEFLTAFNYTAHEIVLMGRYPYLSPFSFETEADLMVVRQAMEETDVWHLRRRRFNELSGGEKQRVVLASALAQVPRILLLDEPTSALDIKHQRQFYGILRLQQREKQMTIVTVTHDINLASRYCQRLIVLKEGQVVADGTPEHIVRKDLMESVYEVAVEILRRPQDGKPMLILDGA